MKRAVGLGFLGLGIAVLAGCPIYPDDRDHRVCVGGDCYDCPDSYYSGACVAWTCNGSSDCPSGYSCNSEHRCKLTDGVPPGPTGGTINSAVEALIRAGAAEHFLVGASHAVFTAKARQNLSHASIRKIIVTNSIPVSADDWPQVKVVSLAPILAEAIRRSVAEGQAVPRD